jgi:hypothetical protein
MTSHVKDKKDKDELDIEDDREEDPEDGIDDALADIEEEEQGNADIDDE